MNETGLLTVYNTEEKEAYIGVIASIATADRTATEDELEYLDTLSEATGINPAVAEAAAKDKHSRDVRTQRTRAGGGPMGGWQSRRRRGGLLLFEKVRAAVERA